MREGADPRVYLADILDAARNAQEFVTGVSLEEFQRDTKTVFAVIRALEVIGEATKHIRDAERKMAPEVPWRRMAGMRDVLIHDYLQVDLKVVWETARGDLPGVIENIERLLEELDDRSGAG